MAIEKRICYCEECAHGYMRFPEGKLIINFQRKPCAKGLWPEWKEPGERSENIAAWGWMKAGCRKFKPEFRRSKTSEKK